LQKAAKLDGWHADSDPGWIRAKDYLQQRYQIDEMIANLKAKQRDPQFGYLTQKAISHEIDKKQWERLLEDFDGDEENDRRSRLRLLSLKDYASHWLLLPPVGENGMDNAMFGVSMKFRLGLPIYDEGTTCPMKNCNKELDPSGYHASVCMKGGHIANRHNGVRDSIHRILTRAMLNPKREQGGLIGATKEKPADILVPNLYNSNPAALDVSIINTGQPKYLKTAHVNPIEILEKYGKEVKEKKYTAACRAKQLEFIPLMANIYGTWAPPAMKVFRLAADMIQAHENISKSSAMFQVMSSINVVLVKRLATCLLMRVTGLHDDNNNNLEEDSDR